MVWTGTQEEEEGFYWAERIDVNSRGGLWMKVNLPLCEKCLISVAQSNNLVWTLCASSLEAT